MATKASAGTGDGNAAKSGRTTGKKSGAPAGKKSGRTTDKKARESGSARYTPPVPKKAKASPKWMGVLIIGLFVLGVLIIILNYAALLPGGVDNWWLVAAIGSIFAGLMVATRYR
jgi:hypothetical protein